MKINPNKWSEDRSLCERTYCESPRWAPYSWNYCPDHLVEAAIEIDQEREENFLEPVALKWVRSRFCGVLNGYTPDLGDVSWDTNYPREQLAEIATEIGLDLDETKEVQWRTARAKIAGARSGKKWDQAYRSPPIDYEGPGARRALSRTAAQHRIESYYDGESRVNR